MALGDSTGPIPESRTEGFIVFTDDDCRLSVEDGEPCPRCGSYDKVRGPTNRWQCKKCNRTWFRKMGKL